MDLEREIRNSRLVSLDFETIESDESLIPFEATPEGASIGWLDSKTGEVQAEYWTFEWADRGKNKITWRQFEEKFLRGMWNAPREKSLIFHNTKFDAQIAIRQMNPGLVTVADVWKLMPKCTVEDTMVMAFLLDENERKDLKSISKRYLGKPRKTYEQTKAEMKSLDIQCKREIKAKVAEGWREYRQLKRGSGPVNLNFFEEEGETRPEDKWSAAVRALPGGMKKAEFEHRYGKFVEDKIVPKYIRKIEKKMYDYGKEDAHDTLSAFILLEEQLKAIPKVYRWYREVELPFTLYMVEVEIGGVHVNVEDLEVFERDVRKMLDTRKAALQHEIKSRWGLEEFNPNSHDQIKELLWNKMKLKAPKWAKATEKGLPSTSADVQLYLADQGHEICRRMVEYGAYQTLHSTFLEPMFRRGSKNGEHRVRTSFKPQGAVTGRIASSPNLQNIPNEDKMPVVDATEMRRMYPDMNGTTPNGWKSVDEGYQMEPLRKVFEPRPGYKYLIADYSQIELRMMACITRDKTMLEAYCRWDCECGKAGYTREAIHNCPECGAPDGERDVTNPEQPVKHGFCLGLDLHSLTGVKSGLFAKYGPKKGRKYAKSVNFGLIYGEHWKTLAKDLEVSEQDAEEVYNGYFRTYPRVYAFHQYVPREIARTGQFPLLLGGRVRRFHAQKEKIKMGLMKKWELRKVTRDALNNLPQGSAMDVVKLGTIGYVYRKRMIDGLKDSHICLQIHDEVVVQVREEHTEKGLEVLIPSLENAVKVAVPITVDAKICNTWAEGK